MTETVEPVRETPMERWMPGIRQLRRYDTSWLPRDLTAGITLGAVMVPVGLAFGEMAGLPLAGLYAGIFPLIVYALFGSSRQLIIGPDASMSALIAVSLAPMAGGDAARLAMLAGLLAVLIGVICVLGSFLHLGVVADFMAKAIIAGFMNGMALVIAVGQLPKVLRVEGGGETTLAQFLSVCRNVGDTHAATLAIGVSCVAVILAFRRWLPRIPGQLVALVGATLAVYLLRLDHQGVAVVGEIPRGLPGFRVPIPSVQELQSIIPLAFAAALLALSDSLATARGFASRGGYRLDANQEMLALGLGNITAGLTQGLPVGASGSRTATAESAGSRTQLTSVVAAVTLACVMLFLTGLLYYLPSAALGGILIAAALNMWDLGELRRVWRFRRTGLVGAVLTLIGVVCIGVLPGIGIGVLFSLVLVMKALAAPSDAVLGRVESGEYRNLARHPNAETTPGVVAYRFSGPLFFANATAFRDRVKQAVDASEPPAAGLVLDAAAIVGLDLAACEVLADVNRDLEGRGIRFVIADMQGDVQEALMRGWQGEVPQNVVFADSVGAGVRYVQERSGA